MDHTYAKPPSMPLFDKRPASKSGDPYTSDLAEKRVTESGQRQTDCMKVLELLREHNGSTSRELSQFSKFDRYKIAKRLSDLHNIKKVEYGPKRKCSVAGSKAVPWFIV